MSSPPLLLLHGALSCSAQFHKLEPLLAPHFTVHKIDFRGHGSAPLEGTFDTEGFAQDVLTYLDAHDIETVDIFGYSLGGYVAVYLAKTQPKRVGRIFTLATKYCWDPEGAEREVRMLDPDKIEAKVPAFAKALEAMHVGIGWRLLLAETSCMMTGLAANPPLAEGLEAIEHPIQVAVGDRDKTAGVEDSLTTWRRFPNARFQVFPGLPHPFEKANPQVVAQAIKDFMLV